MKSQIKVEYIQHVGEDLTVVNAARISFASESKTLTDRDKKLIKYLADNKHYSCFEHNIFTVKIECPLYIRSQIMRHRSFSFNEVSRRYTDKDLEFYLPEYRKQSKSNKQASDGKLETIINEVYVNRTFKLHEEALSMYENMIKSGVAKEQARGILPQNLMTSFIMTGNLRNWMHFVELRDHDHAQLEVQWIAKDIKNIIMNKFPEAAKALLG
jgi:thymidylate synthase (FAD)